MTREEIKKAVKDGESVWYHKERTIKQMDLKNTPLFFEGYQIDILIKDENGWHAEFYGIKDLYKTKAEAEHYLKHANITRTEQLPFLTWEEFKEIRQISFIGKDKKEYILKKDITWSNNKYTLVDCLKIVNETDFTFSKYFDYTEENFYKAYDECVRLFKGEV